MRSKQKPVPPVDDKTHNLVRRLDNDDPQVCADALKQVNELGSEAFVSAMLNDYAWSKRNYPKIATLLVIGVAGISLGCLVSYIHLGQVPSGGLLVGFPGLIGCLLQQRRVRNTTIRAL